MEKKINELEKHEHELEVTLTYDEIKPEIDEAYKKERKNISISGFRKGKVPLQMVKKLYGDAIEYQASESIANKKFWDLVESDDLKPISTPRLTDIDFVKDEKLSFKVKYEVKPVLELKDYKDLEIEKPIFKVKDEDIQKEVDHLLKAHAKFEDVDKIENDDCRITTNLQRVDDKGEAIEGSRSENMVIDLSEPNINAEIKENAIGKKIGETFSFTFVDEHKHEEESHSEKYLYDAEILKIEKTIYPEVDEELVKKISNNKATKIDEFKNQLKENFEKYYEGQSENIFINSLMNQIVKNNDFDPPNGYVETITDRLVETEKENAKRYNTPIGDEADLHKSIKPRAEWNAKWQIVLGNLARIENISVDDSELEKLAEEEASKTGISVKKLVKYYKDSNREESLLEEKVINFLKENTKVKEIDPAEKTKEIKETKE